MKHPCIWSSEVVDCSTCEEQGYNPLPEEDENIVKLCRLYQKAFSEAKEQYKHIGLTDNDSRRIVKNATQKLKCDLPVRGMPGDEGRACGCVAGACSSCGLKQTGTRESDNTTGVSRKGRNKTNEHGSKK